MTQTHTKPTILQRQRISPTAKWTGSFNVSRANSSEIRVFIWDNASFTNWQNERISKSQLGRAISFYGSGPTTNDAIEASPYRGGTYFLIYQNNSTELQNVTSQTFFWYMQK